MNFSVILLAYKEKSLNNLIKRLLNQDLPKRIILKKIVVVACGYEDLSSIKNKKVKIIQEKVRRGKASAINSGLNEIDTNIVVLESGDTLPEKDTVKKLLEPFSDPNIGITAGRPIPSNDKRKFIGFLNHLVWLLHHLVSLENPKVGEMFAFRKVIEKIPRKLAADESYFEFIMRKKGYKIIYVPDAIIFNKGPESLNHFLKQRRRIFNGHLHIRKKYGYAVSTMSIIRISKFLLRYFEIESIKNLKEIIWIFIAVCLEGYARFLAVLDFYLFKKLPYKWEIINK